MTTMVTEVYDALVEAGASEEKARKAAAVLADYEHNFSDIRSTLRLHTWQLALLAALQIATFVKLFVH